jgi:hypothetical protein
MTEQLLQAAMDSGELATQPVRPLAHILIGALDAAALTIAHSEDPDRTGIEVRNALDGIVNGMLAGRP